MKKFYQPTLTIVVVWTLVVGISHLAFAQGEANIADGPLKEADWFKHPGEGALNESHADNKNWITKWYGPDGNYENNEGFQKSGRRDLIKVSLGRLLVAFPSILWERRQQFGQILSEIAKSVLFTEMV